MCLLQALLHMYGIVRVAGVDFLACGTSCLNRFLNHNIMTLITFSANIQVSHWCTLQPAPSWQLFYIHIDNMQGMQHNMQTYSSTHVAFLSPLPLQTTEQE